MELRWPGGFSTAGGHKRLSLLLKTCEELVNLTTKVLEDRARFLHAHPHPLPLQFEGIPVPNDVSKAPKRLHCLRKVIREKHRKWIRGRGPKSTEELNVPISSLRHVQFVKPNDPLEDILDPHVDRPEKVTRGGSLPDGRSVLPQILLESDNFLNGPVHLIQFDADLLLQFLQTAGA